MDILFLVINGTNTNSDPNLIYGTWALVIATVIGIAITSWFTKESLKETRKSSRELRRSNELLRMDLTHKFEPNLGFSNLRIQYETDKVNANFYCEIKNHGKIALHEFTVWCQVINEKPTNDLLIKSEKEIKSEPNKDYLGTFPPNAKTHDFKKMFNEPDHENIFAIMWFEFEIMNEKQEMIVFHTFKKLQHKGYDIIPHSKIKKLKSE